jgi:hypothetical protein
VERYHRVLIYSWVLGVTPGFFACLASSTQKPLLVPPGLSGGFAFQGPRAAFTLVRSPIPTMETRTETISTEASSANVIISMVSGENAAR